MGKVNIYKPYEYPYDLAVIIEGECNHADYSLEEDSEDFYDTPDSPAQTFTYMMRVCNKCKAYKRDDFDESEPWNGITVMVEPYVFNNGKLVSG